MKVIIIAAGLGKRISVKPILISGKWYEIDTIEDLQRAEQEIN